MGSKLDKKKTGIHKFKASILRLWGFLWKLDSVKSWYRQSKEQPILVQQTIIIVLATNRVAPVRPAQWP